MRFPNCARRLTEFNQAVGGLKYTQALISVADAITLFDLLARWPRLARLVL